MLLDLHQEVTSPSSIVQSTPKMDPEDSRPQAVADLYLYKTVAHAIWFLMTLMGIWPDQIQCQPIGLEFSERTILSFEEVYKVSSEMM